MDLIGLIIVYVLLIIAFFKKSIQSEKNNFSLKEMSREKKILIIVSSVIVLINVILGIFEITECVAIFLLLVVIFIIKNRKSIVKTKKKTLLVISLVIIIFSLLLGIMTIREISSDENSNIDSKQYIDGTDVTGYVKGISLFAKCGIMFIFLLGGGFFVGIIWACYGISSAIHNSIIKHRKE